MDSNTVKKEPENIFDLTKLAPFELDVELKKASTIINIDEQTKLLNGFVEISREKWDNLKFNDHIRYLRVDGTFRKGGFFKNSWIGTYGKNKGKNCVQLGSNKSIKSTSWSLCFDDINKIWKNENITGAATSNVNNNSEKNIDSGLKNTVDTLQETVQYMSKSIEQLKIDMLKINNEQKRIINLIMKFHGIKRS
jgi:hypothetical protein